MIEKAVEEHLSRGPVSGGALIERFWASDMPFARRGAAAVYAVLGNLRRAGRAEIVADGPGERLWGAPGAVAPPPREPGPPPCFALRPGDTLRIARWADRATRGLPRGWFEELRRAGIAGADRRASQGEAPARAVETTLAALGPAPAVRRLLRRVEAGRHARPVLPRPARLRPWLVLGSAAVLLLALRTFVIGVYRVPSSSMAPALLPAAEDGDRVMLAYKLAYLFSEPARGDLVVFRPPDRDEVYVKRVMGLPGEQLRIGGGDLHVGGARLVKERDLLDRVKATLFGKEDFVAEGPRRLVQPEPLHKGYRGADGAIDGARDEGCPEIVVTARVVARGEPCTFVLEIDDGSRHAVVLATSPASAGAFVSGVEVERGSAFALQAGTVREVWVTNADRVFRVEVDGVEVARAPLREYGRVASCTLSWDGAGEVVALEAARDVVYEQPPRAHTAWTLAEDEVLALGDNSRQSRDSRAFGPVPLDRVEGRVFAVAWPPSRFRTVGAAR